MEERDEKSPRSRRVSVEGLSGKNTIHEVLGIEILQLDRDRVVLTMPVDHRTHQPYGLLHGGASVVLAESAASIGTGLYCDPEKEAPVGLEINANHIRPKRDGLVRAEATPLHRGKKTMVWDIRIKDERDRLISVSRCTVAIVARRD